MINENYCLDAHGLFYLSKKDIEREVEEDLKQYDSSLLIKPSKINILHYLEYHLGLDIEYKKLSSDHTCYGTFVFNKGKLTVYDEDNKPYDIIVKEKTVIIDSDIAELDDSFANFTYSHEGGHYFTQYNALNRVSEDIQLTKEYYAKNIENDFEFRDYSFGQRRNLITKQDWMEWQANYAGACILMNRSSVLILLSKLLKFDNLNQEGISKKVI
ncbi:MAG: hypothetical protein IJ875_05665, partial [Solobacterium sp.]|nr:hypothetical protein [Solobacterium sp.]